MSRSTQRKIENIVKEYIKMFPEEFQAFKTGHRIKVGLQANKYATTEAEGVVKQLVYEIPETLLTMFRMGLSSEQWAEFDSEKGTLWFGRTYKVFKVAEKI